MKSTPWAELLPHVREFARAAGDAILPYFRTGTIADRKADGSPVTAADRAAEAVIVPALLRLAPMVPVISEESGDPEAAAAVGSGPFWLVDPLDGTREFLKGLPEFTVNIGLVVDRVPVLGVITIPVTGVQYWGVMGVGAGQRDRAGVDRPIRARVPPDDGPVAVISRSFGDDARTDRFLAATGVVATRRAGSSLKFCEIACGTADVYPRFGPTCEWDTAAGHAIVTSAGGAVRQLDGRRLDYGKPGLRNPDFVAIGVAEPGPGDARWVFPPVGSAT